MRIKLLSLFLLLAGVAAAQSSGNAVALQGKRICNPLTTTNAYVVTWSDSLGCFTLSAAGGAPSGAAGGDLGSTYPNPTVLATHLSSPLPIAQGGLATTSPAFASQTDGSTVTWALASALVASGTLTFTTHGGNRTLNITNPVSGGSYVLKLVQDSTGGEGLILGTGCTWKVLGGGAGVITLSTGASAIDILAFTYDGTNCIANFNTNAT